MQDLTQGSIPRHLFKLAGPIAIGMLFQTLYYLVDLYFIGQLGDAAIAGVSAAGNVQFIVMAVTQILGVGTMALIAQATGRKDRDDANLIFNQSLILAAVCALLVIVGGYGLTGHYMRTLGADAATTQAGATYLYWFIPGLGLQFALVAMGSALRGTGIVKPTMIVQVSTVILNALLSPVLIAGWVTGKPLGVLGAALSTTISIAVGVVMLWLYFVRLEKFVAFDPAQLMPRLPVWKRILKIGLPPGGEFGLIFVYVAFVYWMIRDFGAAAQAGFGVGSRVMQAIFLPAMAVAFASAPLAGQNFGAGNAKRVRSTFLYAALFGSAIMLVLTLLCQWRPEWPVSGFTDDPEVLRVAAEFLQIIAWNFVATGLIFTCSSHFQALGNTIPSLVSMGSRIFTFLIPGLWLASRPGFELRHIWYLSVATVAFQALFSWWLLQREFGKKLAMEPTDPVRVATG